MPDITLTIDGRNYTVGGSDKTTHGDLENYVNEIRSSPLHQSYLQDTAKQQADAAALKAGSFDNLQTQRFMKEFGVDANEGQRIAFDVKTKGYEQAKNDFYQRQNVNALTTQRDNAGQALSQGNPFPVLGMALQAPGQVINRAVTKPILGDYDSLPGQSFQQKTGDVFGLHALGQNPGIAGVAGRFLEGLSDPGSAVLLGAGPALKIAGGAVNGLSAFNSAEAAALAEAGSSTLGSGVVGNGLNLLGQGLDVAGDIANKANLGLAGGGFVDSLPDLAKGDVGTFAEKNLANALFAGVGLRGKLGEVPGNLVDSAIRGGDFGDGTVGSPAYDPSLLATHTLNGQPLIQMRDGSFSDAATGENVPLPPASYGRMQFDNNADFLDTYYMKHGGEFDANGKPTDPSLYKQLTQDVKKQYGQLTNARNNIRIDDPNQPIPQQPTPVNNFQPAPYALGEGEEGLPIGTEAPPPTTPLLNEAEGVTPPQQAEQPLSTPPQVDNKLPQRVNNLNGELDNYRAMAEAKQKQIEANGWKLQKQSDMGDQLYRNVEDPTQGLVRTADGNQSGTSYAAASRKFNTFGDPVPDGPDVTYNKTSKRFEPTDGKVYLQSDIPTLEEASALTPLDRLKQVQDAAHNYLQENFTGLKRESPDVYNNVVKYASSPLRAAQFTSDTLPHVLEGLSPDDAARFQRYGVADTTETFANRTGGYKPEFAYQPKGGRLLDPVDNTPITRAKLDAYFSKPEVQDAVAKWKQDVQPMLTHNVEAGGYEAGGDLGKRSGAFFPKLALDENGYHYGVSGENTKGALQLGDVPGGKAFKAEAHDYEPDAYVAAYHRVNAGLKFANKIDLVKSLIDTGTAIDPRNNPDSVGRQVVGTRANRATGKIDPTTMTVFNGHVEPGYRFSLSSYFNDAQLKRLDLPSEIVIPKRFANEITTAFEAHKGDMASEYISNLHNSLVKASITGPGDAMAHSFSLGSRLQNAKNMLPSTRNYNNLVRGVTGMGGLFGFHEIANVKYTPQEHAAVVQMLAEQGRLPGSYGSRPAPLEEGVKGKAFGLADKLENYLNGKDGIVVKAAIRMYQYVNALPGGVEAHDGVLRDMFSELNTSVNALKPTLAKTLNKLNIGDYYQTGIKNRASFFHQPLAKIVGTIAVGALSKVLLYKYSDPKGKWPWEDPSYKFGDVHLPFIKDGSGGNYVINVNAGDKTLSYAQKMLGTLLESKARGRNPLNTATNLLTDAGNNIVTPAASGPVVGAASALAGYSPHLTPADGPYKLPLPVMETKEGNLPFDSLGRLAAVGQAILPQSQVFGDMHDVLSKTPVQNVGAKAANSVLKLGGISGIRKQPLAYDVLAQERRRETPKR